MNLKSTRETNSYRLILIITLSVVVSLFLISLLISPIINGIIKPKILAKINSENTIIDIEHAGYSVFTNKITVKNVSLLYLDKKDTISLKMESAHLYINWFHLAFKDGYSFGGIKANNILINQSFFPKEEPESNSDKELFAFLDTLSAELPFIHSDYIDINNTSYIRKDLTSGLTDSIKGINLKLDNVTLDSSFTNYSNLRIAENIELKIEKVKMYFGSIRYKLAFDSLNLSSSDKAAKANTISFEPYMDDISFFSSKKFRADRFRFFAKNLSMKNLNLNDLIRNNRLTANYISLKNFTFDALTNMRLPADPNAEPPEMPNKAVNSIPVKLNINRMDMINGNILVKEIYPYDQSPGVLQFANLNAKVTNIKNNSNVHLDINTLLTGSGKLDVKFNLGLSPGKLKFDYSGRLGEMSATDLNKFIVVADRVQVKTGNIKEVKFRIEATGDSAAGTATPFYSDLSINELDDETGKASGLLEKFNSFIANAFVIKKNNPGKGEPVESATTVYIRQPDDAFMEYVWKALKTALGEVVGFE